MSSFIESLRDRILNFPLNELECMDHALLAALHNIVNGKKNQQVIHALLWVGLQQARGRAITLRGLRSVRLGHCDDQLFMALTAAMATFAQAPELQQMANKKSNRQPDKMDECLIAKAVEDIEEGLLEPLAPEERRQLQQEAALHNQSLTAYLKEHVLKLLTSDG